MWIPLSTVLGIQYWWTTVNHLRVNDKWRAMKRHGWLEVADMQKARASAYMYAASVFVCDRNRYGLICAKEHTSQWRLYWQQAKQAAVKLDESGTNLLGSGARQQLQSQLVLVVVFEIDINCFNYSLSYILYRFLNKQTKITLQACIYRCDATTRNMETNKTTNLKSNIYKKNKKWNEDHLIRDNVLKQRRRKTKKKTKRTRGEAKKRNSNLWIY